MSNVWATAEYSGNKLLLLLALADFANDDGSRVFPSVDELARKIRSGRRTVQRTLREFEEDGTIVKVREATSRSAAEYRIGAAFCAGQGRQNDAPADTTSGGVKMTPQGRQDGTPGASNATARGVKMTPNSPINHQELTTCVNPDSESSEATQPHTHDLDVGEEEKGKPPTESQVSYIRSLCRQRDISVPKVATATEAAELIDDLKAGKLPERDTDTEAAPVEPHPSNFGRCGRCKANPVRRNAMGLCEGCVAWLAEDKDRETGGAEEAA